MAAPHPLSRRLLHRETYDDPTPHAAWTEDTRERITDPFDEGGACPERRALLSGEATGRGEGVSSA